MRASVRPTAFVALCALACAGWLTLRPDETLRVADKYMRAQTIASNFSGAVLIAQHGQVVFAGGYGDADCTALRGYVCECDGVAPDPTAF